MQTLEYSTNQNYNNQSVDLTNQQYQTLQPADQSILSQQAKMLSKIQKKSHLRSLTSQKPI